MPERAPRPERPGDRYDNDAGLDDNRPAPRPAPARLPAPGAAAAGGEAAGSQAGGTLPEARSRAERELLQALENMRQ
ncbi:hypothetical protein [Nitrospirillum viridazoti]|uniref:Uncharacterized protein n=2 Tax=Nitrospirillum TaxID=1543705 RepID=A0A248JPH5_9PROT|nr:hypothetical protein [Nitrospirillum amazonense]ASG20411.1 hypothetical protein Y958_05985 [Nitrospirillum amazonense CBAmc]